MRRQERADARASCGRAALDPAPPGRAARRAGLHAHGAPPSSSTTSSAQLSRRRAAADYADLEPAGWYLEDYHILQGTRTEDFHAAVRRHLEASGVPVENSKGEWGLGQHELNVRYAEALEMADRHVVFKQCLKEIADRMGVSVTFMAKFAADRAGSSCHIHLSLWRDGTERVRRRRRFGPVKCSDVFRWFLGGWIARVPEVMVFYAPTVNSYKRYRRRVVGADAARVELRQPHRRVPRRRPRPEPAHRVPHPGRRLQPVSRLRRLARVRAGRHRATGSSRPNASSATSTRANDPAARAVHAARGDGRVRERASSPRSAFGADVVEHYTHFFRTEQAAFDAAVTDWERKRYLRDLRRRESTEQTE